MAAVAAKQVDGLYGADIVQLCTGEHTVAAIVERLAEKYAPQPADAIEREVLTFLHAMFDRGLIRSEP